MKRISNLLILVMVILAIAVPFTSCSKDNGTKDNTDVVVDAENNNEKDNNLASENEQTKNKTDEETTKVTFSQDDSASTFTNEDAGVEIAIPEGWFTYDDEMLETISKQADPSGSTQIVIMLYKEDPSVNPRSENLNLTVQSMEALEAQGIKTIEDYLYATKVQLATIYEQQGFECKVDDAEKVTVNDKEMYKTHILTNAGVEFHQEVYTYEKDGKMIQFALTYTDDEGKENVNKAFNSTKFN